MNARHLWKLTFLLHLVASLSACAPTATTDRHFPEATPIVADTSPLSDEEKSRYLEAMNHMRTRNYKAAQPLLGELASARPMLAGPQANLGLVYFYLGDLEKSASAATKALQINPRLPQTHFLLGLLKTKQHDYAGAEKHYLSAIELNKNYTNAHYNLALLYDVYFQQPDKSLPYYKTYLRLTPQRDQQTQDWINHLESSQKKGPERR